MPRRPRRATGGFFYHVANRASGSKPIFSTQRDYQTFERTLEETQHRLDIRLLSYCLLPDRWQLLLWPRRDGDLSEFMRLLTVTHVQRWHSVHGTTGSGSLYKSRFKSFPIQKGAALLSVFRYIESAPLRAKKVKKAKNWRWGSLWHRLKQDNGVTLALCPVEFPKNWASLINEPIEADELIALDNSAERDTPYGTARWQKNIAVRLGLESTLRRRGRPKKH